jgi:hypothetical protein
MLNARTAREAKFFAGLCRNVRFQFEANASLYVSFTWRNNVSHRLSVLRTADDSSLAAGWQKPLFEEVGAAKTTMRCEGSSQIRMNVRTFILVFVFLAFVIFIFLVCFRIPAGYKRPTVFVSGEGSGIPVALGNLEWAGFGVFDNQRFSQC